MITIIIGGIVLLALLIGTIYVLVDSIQPIPGKSHRRKRRNKKIVAIHEDKTGEYIEAAWTESQK